MKKKIITYKEISDSVLERLNQQFEVSYFEDYEDINKDDRFSQALKEVEGIIGSGLKVDKALLDQAPHLKIVSNISVGYNNLDIDELTKRKIMATNTPDVLTETVADTVLGLILSTARRIPELDRFVKSGQWKKSVTQESYSIDVHHKTLGIIGMGRIGEAIAKRAYLGFSMPILYHSRTPKPLVEEKYQATFCSLPELLKASDFVVLITPLTKETEGLLGLEEFRQMKKSAIFINASRGKTIVEKELIQALKEGSIKAAGLDVFEQEPVDPANPLLTMDSVVTLPHAGSATFETRLKMAELAEENLIAGLKGEKPSALINQDVWPK